jgi:hypothetical protein
MTIISLVLSLQHIGTGRRLGTASAAALGVVVLLATRVVSPADLANGVESYGDHSSPSRPSC